MAGHRSPVVAVRAAPDGPPPLTASRAALRPPVRAVAAHHRDRHRGRRSARSPPAPSPLSFRTRRRRRDHRGRRRGAGDRDARGRTPAPTPHRSHPAMAGAAALLPVADLRPGRRIRGRRPAPRPAGQGGRHRRPARRAARQRRPSGSASQELVARGGLDAGSRRPCRSLDLPQSSPPASRRSSWRSRAATRAPSTLGHQRPARHPVAGPDADHPVDVPALRRTPTSPTGRSPTRSPTSPPASAT